MKISKETLDVLKNFSAINPNLVIEQGNKLSTIAEAKNIMASCEVAETFDKDIGIYDLNEFLSALSLIEDPEFVFGDQSVSIKSDLTSLTYRYADKSILTSPEKGVNMPEADVNVQLSAEVINHIRRAGAALNHPIVSITTNANETKLYLQVKDPSNSSSNIFQHEIDSDYDANAAFDFQFLISNLKLIGGDYEVSVSSKLISHWKCINNSSVEYWIALEKTSVT
tara:strand:+ start:7828 stop:8502 length:675 start_codon:yes stop_codon:yes gene_type:complete